MLRRLLLAALFCSPALPACEGLPDGFGTGVGASIEDPFPGCDPAPGPRVPAPVPIPPPAAGAIGFTLGFALRGSERGWEQLPIAPFDSTVQEFWDSAVSDAGPTPG